MSDTKANMKVEPNKPPPPPFPKWCKLIRNDPQTVTSLLTKEKVKLSAKEVSMYCYLYEAEYNFTYRPELLINDPNVKEKYEEGMIWFDSTNPRAFKALGL